MPFQAQHSLIAEIDGEDRNRPIVLKNSATENRPCTRVRCFDFFRMKTNLRALSAPKIALPRRRG